MTTPTQAFRAARDFLLAHRDDYATAYAGFQWPKLDRFNWALDWFDQIAAGHRRNQVALWVAYEDGRHDKLTFAELSERSNRFANYYRGLGVKRGDRVLLMLGNIPPLWETMLAMMKLGAVIIPATTLLTANDVADRIARGYVKHIVCAADLAPKIEAACGSCTRIVELLLCALERRSHGLCDQPIALQRPRPAGRAYRQRRNYLLRPAHRLAHVDYGKPQRLESASA
jgi:acetyl-CoA synthetase